jgi:carbamoyl-phosphate synthase large subunit
MLNIGVTGTGSLVGQAIIKCIKQSGFYKDAHLTGFDYVPETVGSYWVDENIILPDITRPEISYETAADAMIGHLQKNNIDILFIGIDFDLPMYAQYKAKIEAAVKTKIIVNSEQLIAIADDKYKTFEFLKSNGFTYPDSYFPEDVPAGFKFPAIIKPCTGASSIGVSIVKNIEEVKERAASLQNPVVQELVGTADDEYTCGVVYLDGKLIDSIVLKRKLKKGDTFKAVHRKDFPQIIYTYINNLSSALKPTGVCNFQLRLDSEGIPKMFEINARHSGTTYFRCLFNYNEIEMILNYYFPVKDYVKPEKTYGMAMRFFEEKIVETF